MSLLTYLSVLSVILPNCLSLLSWSHSKNERTVNCIIIDEQHGFHPGRSVACTSPRPLAALTIILCLVFSLKTLYCSFVRSVLEYGIIIWEPCTIDGSCQLERVQRTFLKFAAFALGIECAPNEYEPVLQRLRLSTLCDRRKQGNLTFLSKLINGEVDAPFRLSKVNFRVPTYCSWSSSHFIFLLAAVII